MKPIIPIFFLILFIFGLANVSAGHSVSCSPDSGFDWCYGYEESDYGDSYCYAEVQGSYPKCDGTQDGDRCAGAWYINIGIEGDKVYLVKSASDWSISDQCNANGCPSQYEFDGEGILQDVIGQLVPKYYLIAWDSDSASDGSSCWAYITGGYLGDYFPGLSVVECVNNNDCSGGEVCSNNVCSTPECTGSPTQSCQVGSCAGTQNRVCTNGVWGDWGTCIKTDPNCGACTENWQCSGFGACVSGIQTQTCTDLNNCGTIVNRPPLTQSCSGNEITIFRLANNTCTQMTILPADKNPATDYDTLALCQSHLSGGITTLAIILIILGAVVLIGGLTFLYLKTRR